MTKQELPDIRSLIVEKTLELATEHGWGNICFNDISARSQIQLDKIYREFPDKYAILTEYEKELNQKILKTFSDDEINPDTHDMLLDVLMERFELMQKHRKALISAYKHYIFSPVDTAKEIPMLSESMRWTLELCGIDAGGIRGHMRIVGMAAIYLKTLITWVRDNEEDMDSVMAELDRNLRRAEKLADFIGI